MTRLVLLIVALAAIAGLGYGLWILAHRHADATTYEHELDQEYGSTDGTTLLAMPETDLVGTISDDDPDPDAGFVAAEVDLPGAGEDAAGAQVLLGVDARGSVAADVAVAVRVRLTPAQRRRALHKGRIPRTSTAGESCSRLRAEQVQRGAQAAPTTPAVELHHERHERIPQPLEVWDPAMHDWMPVFPTLLESARHEAHFRQWESEIGVLINGAYAWLEQVPA